MASTENLKLSLSVVIVIHRGSGQALGRPLAGLKIIYLIDVTNILTCCEMHDIILVTENITLNRI